MSEIPEGFRRCEPGRKKGLDIDFYCGVIKVLDEFNGGRKMCKNCANKQLRNKLITNPDFRARKNAQLRKHYYKHHDKYLNRNKRLNSLRYERVRNDPVLWARELELRRNWADQNQEKSEDIKKRSRNKHRDALNARRRYRYKNDPGPWERAVANRKRSLSGKVKINDLTADDMREVMSIGKCEICGNPVNLQFDHMKPVSKGGNNTKSNGMCLCRSCNLKKHAKIVWDGNQARLDALFVV